MNALVYVDIDQGIYLVKNEKKLPIRGFSYTQNMENVEAFL